MYYYKIVRDGITYSLDNCVVEYWCKLPFSSLLDECHRIRDVSDCKNYYENLDCKMCSKYQYFNNQIHLTDGVFLVFGKYTVYLEEKKEFKLLPVLRLEVNPNKHYDKVQLVMLLNWIEKNCSRGDLRRYDLALDYPGCMDDVMVVSKKERGLYKGTRYYGQRMKHGFLKIYNKKLEHNTDNKKIRLDCMKRAVAPPDLEDVEGELTRIEYIVKVGDKLPIDKIYVNSSEKETVPMSSTVRVLVDALIALRVSGVDLEPFLDGLDKRTKKTVKTVLVGGMREVVIEPEIVADLINNVARLLYYQYEDKDGFMVCDTEEEIIWE